MFKVLRYVSLLYARFGCIVSMLDVRQSVNVGLTEAGSYRASMHSDGP